MEKRNLINKMKDDIKKDFANPSNVIADNLAITPQSIKAILPSRRNIRRILNYSSTKDIPREPLTVSELVIPDNLKKIGTKIFLIFDTKNRFEHNRILMFGVRETLNLLEQCEYWAGDGTFKSCPKLFTQIYTIHVYRFKNVS